MMTQLPWTTLSHRGLAQLASNLPTTLLLLDLQRGNADDVARAIMARALCLNPATEPRPCGGCKSCHLLAQQTHPDILFFIDSNKIEQIRNLSQQLQTTPVIGEQRIVYLGAIDLYNEYALNALLKTLEEPQKHSRFILSAAHRRAVKPTILSRSHIIDLPQPTATQAREWLLTQNFTLEQADAALAFYYGNPHQAVNRPDAPNPNDYFDDFVHFLHQPQMASAFLSKIDNIKGSDLLNILQNQLEAIIFYRQIGDGNQLDSNKQNWQNRLKPLANKIDQLDLHRLHTLYARLCALRHPHRQQIGLPLNIKALLLYIFDKRNLEL